MITSTRIFYLFILSISFISLLSSFTLKEKSLYVNDDNSDIHSLLKTEGGELSYPSFNYQITPHLNYNTIVPSVYNKSFATQAPSIGLSATVVDFEKVRVETSKEIKVTIYNSGEANLVITGIGLVSAYFNHNLTFPLTIVAGGSKDVIFRFSDAPAGMHQVIAKISHNDLNKNPSEITLKAISFEPNDMYVNDSEMKKGSTGVMSLMLYNYSNVIGFQFDITLPEGVAASPESFKLTERATDHSISVRKLSENVFRVVAISTSSTKLLGYKGNIVTFPVTVGHIKTGTYTIGVSKVEVINDKIQNVISSTTNGVLKITGSEPVKSLLVSPVNGSENITLKPDLTWHPSAEATAYKLQVSSAANFNTIIKEYVGISTTSQLIEHGLISNTTYYWRVQALNSSGEGEWSDVWKFTTQPIVTAVSPDYDTGNFKVYPNPSIRNFNLKVPNYLSSGKVQIRDMRGQLIKEIQLSKVESELIIEMPGIFSGMYLVVLLENDKPIGYKRWIKL
jgi:hypothetical protein